MLDVQQALETCLQHEKYPAFFRGIASSVNQRKNEMMDSVQCVVRAETAFAHFSGLNSCPLVVLAFFL